MSVRVNSVEASVVTLEMMMHTATVTNENR